MDSVIPISSNSVIKANSVGLLGHGKTKTMNEAIPRMLSKAGKVLLKFDWGVCNIRKAFRFFDM